MSSSAPSARAAVKTLVLDGSAKIRFPTPGRTSTAVDASQLGSKNAAKGADDAAFAPLITNLADARDEVDRRNEMFQSVIGAKEGLAEALALKVGDRIVDAVTKTTDGYQDKNIDDWECHEIITRIQQGAARSLCKDVIQKVKAALGFKFDHRLQFSENLRNLHVGL